MKPSNVTNLLYQQLNFRGQKQKIIAGNIANINTPDYKTKDISFEGELQKAIKEKDLQLTITHHNHISPNIQKEQHSTKIYDVKGLPEQNDGNNVNLDHQMSAMAQNNIMFEALLKAVKKDSSWMKDVISSSSKN
jgi:flagellar basal-body rod protein FlgB